MFVFCARLTKGGAVFAECDTIEQAEEFGNWFAIEQTEGEFYDAEIVECSERM